MTDIMSIVGPCGSCGAPNIRLHESRRFLIDASTGVPHECAIPSRGGPFSSTAFGGELKVEVSAPVGNISPPDANGVRAICLGYHPDQNEYEWLRVVPESQLLDVCKERDRLAAIHHQDIETIVTATRDIATIQAQLTEARSRILEMENEPNYDPMQVEEIVANRLRSSREQSIAAIEALPRYTPVESSGSTQISDGFWAAEVAEMDDGEYIERSDVLRILQGSE